MAATVATVTRPQATATLADAAPPISFLTASAILFASTSVVIGVLWDISWHQSIGRDTLFSPPHMAMYVGGVVAGIVSGVHVLRTSYLVRICDRSIAARKYPAEYAALKRNVSARLAI